MIKIQAVVKFARVRQEPDFNYQRRFGNFGNK